MGNSVILLMKFLLDFTRDIKKQIQDLLPNLRLPLCKLVFTHISKR